MVDEAEEKWRDGQGCCSTGPISAKLGRSEEAFPPVPSLSGSGEVEEEREVVGEEEEEDE